MSRLCIRISKNQKTSFSLREKKEQWEFSQNCACS